MLKLIFPIKAIPCATFHLPQTSKTFFDIKATHVNNTVARSNAEEGTKIPVEI